MEDNKKEEKDRQMADCRGAPIEKRKGGTQLLFHRSTEVANSNYSSQRRERLHL